MRQQLHHLLNEAFARAWSGSEVPAYVVEIPNDPTHGDFATNIAMLSAKALKSPPRKIAEKLKETLGVMAPGWIESIEIAGPGFINFRIKPAGWYSAIDRAVEAGGKYGQLDTGKGRKVLVEFVSANPTGPLHVGHARGCAVGDGLARVLRRAGYNVTKEYYVNDAGRQMETLGRSLLIRYRQALGSKEEFPEDHYRGDYMKELASQVIGREGDRYLNAPEEDVLEMFTEEAREAIMAGIIEDMRAFRLEFDTYYSEKELYDSGKLDNALSVLKEKGFLQERDGAKWFLSSHFGDEKDRVVVRENGVPTYFASDIAYHREKFERGYDLMIDLWGADHHGYVPRLKGSVQALGLDANRLIIQLVQFVSLVRSGEAVSMTTRGGVFETMKDLVDEVGADAARFIFLMRSPDSSMEFDLDLATRQSMDNPVFYVQYAHARVCSFFAKAAEAGLKVDLKAPLNPALLDSAEELSLAREVSRFPDVIESCARGLQVHLLPHYLMELSRAFHSYYTARNSGGGTRFKAVDMADLPRSQARLKLAHAVALVLRNGLECLGVNAPERMERIEEAAEGE